MKAHIHILMTLFISAVNCDFYSSVSSLEYIFVTETYLVETLKSFLRTNSDYPLYQSFLTKVEIEHEKALQDIEKYFSNPINAYLLIKRLRVDWSVIKQVDMDVAVDTITDSENQNNPFETLETFETYLDSNSENCEDELPVQPDGADLSGAAMGLGRLQKIYQMKTNEMANGNLNGTKLEIEMSASDCFHLGEEFFQNKEYTLALDWLKESIDRWDKIKEEELELTKVNLTEAYHYMSMAAYYLDDIKLANLYNDILLELEPDNKVFKFNKDFAKKTMIKERNKKLKSFPSRDENSDQKDEASVHERYERICRNEIEPSAQQLNPLRCRYVTNNVDFLRIGPLKLEEYNLDPYVAVYYDAIYDTEIEEVLKDSKPYISRSRIGNGNNRTYSERRVCLNSWLEDFKFLNQINQRFSDMIGLSLDSAEDLQVANYGIGGHFEPHWDFVDGLWGINGNRIATTMFYLSDVERGGATVFLHLNISVYPQKGSLLFWYNMHKSLKYDYRTNHAACPVLIGSKWVGSKWFHELGQEFYRPCGLKDDGEIAH